MSRVVIKIAEKSDKNSVDIFTNSYFLESNPLKDAHTGDSSEPFNDNMRFYDSENEEILLATDEDTKQLVGILSAELIDSNETEKLKKYTSEIGDCMDADILNFVAYAETKADIFQRLNINQSFHIQTVSVHPNHRRQGIAKKLFEACFELAKSKNLEVVSTDCVNLYASKIAEKLGMECLSTVTYDEYNEHLGKQLFVTNSPHNEIRSYAKRL